MTRNSTRLLLLIAATVFFSSALPIPASAQTVSFVAQRDFVSGGAPQSVAVGDSNGDGLPDLVVANGDSNNVSVLINNTALPSNTLSVSKAGTGSAGPGAVAIRSRARPVP